MSVDKIERNSKFNLRPWWNDFFPHANGSNKETSSLWHHEMKIYFIVNFQTWNRFVGTSIYKKNSHSTSSYSWFLLYFFHCMEINHEMKTTERKLADFSRKKIKQNLFLCIKKDNSKYPEKWKTFKNRFFIFLNYVDEMNVKDIWWSLILSFRFLIL